MADLLLTIGETAAALRVSVRQVRALARHGLPVVRLSRKTLLVRRTDLDTFIAARVDTTVSNMLGGGHDRSGGAAGPNAAPPHTGAACRQARRPRDDGEPVGAGSGERGTGNVPAPVARLIRYVAASAPKR